MSKTIVIVDYGMGNIQSVKNALAFLGQDCITSNDPDVISKADAYILPGVGAFPKAMKNLEELGLVEVLQEQVINKKKPLLGICLGMQLVAASSEELGGYEGLNWIPGRVVPLNVAEGIKVPHVGWNDLIIANATSIFKNIENGSNVYFDHSYHFVCDEKYVIATCSYGTSVVAAVQKENIYAAQFHPEKSQTVGLKVLRNFVNVVSQC